MLGVETALDKADKKAIFGPMLASGLKTVLPNNEVKVGIIYLIK